MSPYRIPPFTFSLHPEGSQSQRFPSFFFAPGPCHSISHLYERSFFAAIIGSPRRCFSQLPCQRRLLPQQFLAFHHSKVRVRPQQLSDSAIIDRNSPSPNPWVASSRSSFNLLDPSTRQSPACTAPELRTRTHGPVRQYFCALVHSCEHSGVNSLRKPRLLKNRDPVVSLYAGHRGSKMKKLGYALIVMGGLVGYVFRPAMIGVGIIPLFMGVLLVAQARMKQD